MNPTPYFAKITRPYYSLPAESGEKDEALVALARGINLSSPTLFLDYGCGQGRLLAALAKCRSAYDLANLHYIGVDLHRASLDKARTFFKSTLVASGARACFITSSELQSFHFLVDQVALVFSVHELDPINLDTCLAGLWQMLRKGGCIFIQDTSAPIHEEIEFIAFTPEQLRAVFESIGADVSVKTIVAGRRSVPVFLIEARKPSSLSPYEAYYLPNLRETFRQALHRSVLADSLALLNARTGVESGENVDPDQIAALCHRISVKARAFHQTLAIDEVNSRKAKYCVACGSQDINTKWLPPTVKDSGELTIKCKCCGYEHFHFPECSKEHPGLYLEHLFELIDQGSQDDDLAFSLLSSSLGVATSELRTIIGPFLKRIPGVTQPLMEQVLNFWSKYGGKAAG